MIHDRILSALMGLVGACSNSSPTPDTRKLQAVASALCRSACPPEKVPPLDFFLRALMWIRLDLEPEYLQELLEETRQWNAQLQGEEPEPEPEAGHSRQEG